MAVGRQAIKRALHSTIEKLVVRNELTNAKSLESLFARFERSIATSNSTALNSNAAAATAAADSDPDAPYQIIALLMHLASTRSLLGDTVHVTSPLPNHTVGGAGSAVDLKSPLKRHLSSGAAAADGDDGDANAEYVPRLVPRRALNS